MCFVFLYSIFWYFLLLMLTNILYCVFVFLYFCILHSVFWYFLLLILYCVFVFCISVFRILYFFWCWLTFYIMLCVFFHFAFCILVFSFRHILILMLTMCVAKPPEVGFCIYCCTALPNLLHQLTQDLTIYFSWTVWFDDDDDYTGWFFQCYPHKS